MSDEQNELPRDEMESSYRRGYKAGYKAGISKMSTEKVDTKNTNELAQLVTEIHEIVRILQLWARANHW